MTENYIAKLCEDIDSKFTVIVDQLDRARSMNRDIQIIREDIRELKTQVKILKLLYKDHAQQLLLQRKL